MARIIVTADPTQADDPPVLLEESVSSVHLSTGHAAAQLVERLAWAIADAENAAENAEGAARPDRHASRGVRRSRALSATH
jgi:hypothetical protein